MSEEIEVRESNPIVYLEIQIGTKHVGRIIIELRADVVPFAAEHFRMLCKGEVYDKDTGKLRTYKKWQFYRATQDCNCQAGDVENGVYGTEGKSVYKRETFQDENFTLKHAGPGVLSMANSGPDSNRSSFFISFSATSWLDDRHVVFGYVVGHRSLEIVGKMHDVATASGTPLEKILITDCGQLYP